MEASAESSTQGHTHKDRGEEGNDHIWSLHAAVIGSQQSVGGAEHYELCLFLYLLGCHKKERKRIRGLLLEERVADGYI